MMYNPSAKLSHEESSSGLSHRDSAGDLGLEETSSRYEDDDEAVRTRRLSAWPARTAHHSAPLTTPRHLPLSGARAARDGADVVGVQGPGGRGDGGLLGDGGQGARAAAERGAAAGRRRRLSAGRR